MESILRRSTSPNDSEQLKMLPKNNNNLLYYNLQQQLANFEPYPTEYDLQLSWCKKRGELALQLFKVASELEQESFFSEAAHAYWLAIECAQFGLAIDRMFAEDHKSVRQALPSTLPAEEVAKNYFNAGLRYLGGIGCKQDYNKALQCFQNAVNEQKDKAAALYMLAKMYEKLQNYLEAEKYYHLAAEQDYVLAQCELGHVYSDGLVSKKNRNEANKWYKLAADKGDPIAQFFQGHKWYYGIGDKCDFSKASNWYCLSAEQNCRLAQCNLGFMFQHGQSVTQDYNQALIWYRRALKNGLIDDIKQRLIGFYLSQSYNLSTSPEKLNHYWDDYCNGIEQASIMLERCADTNHYLARYYYAQTRFFKAYQLAKLMAESPNEFFAIIQKDARLTPKAYLGHLKNLADKYLEQLSPENQSSVLFTLAEKLFMIQI